MTDVYRYPTRALRATYIRAVVGVALAGTPLLAGRPGTTVTVVLCALVAVFAVYGLRGLARQRTVIELGADEISALGPMSTRIPWRLLADVRLNYYTTSRDGGDGWLQLTIKGAGKTMRLESTLDGFPSVVERAIGEARARGVALSDTTVSNLKPMGLVPAAEEAE